MTTTIQEYAKSKKLRTHQVKSLIKAVLGDIPEYLSDEDIQKLNKAGQEAATEQAVEDGVLALPPNVDSQMLTSGFETPEKTRIKIQGILDEDLKAFKPSQKSFTAIALRLYEEYNVALARSAANHTYERVVDTLADAEEKLIIPIIDIYTEKFKELHQIEIAATARREEKRKYRQMVEEKVSQSESEVDILKAQLAEAGVRFDPKS